MADEKTPNELRRRPNEPSFAEAHRKLYDKVKALFTDEDLRKYEHDEPMVPFEQVLSELQQIHDEHAKKQKPS